MTKVPGRVLAWGGFASLLLLVLAAGAAAESGALSSSGLAPLAPRDGGDATGRLVGRSVYNGTVVFSCVNADAAGTGSHVLDRDNTGAGQEALRVDITDGFGTLIFTLSFSNTLSTFSGGIGDFFYTEPPRANPITFRLTSLAGNGLPEQLDYEQEGFCDQIAFVGVPALDGRGIVALVGLLGIAALVAVRRLRP